MSNNTRANGIVDSTPRSSLHVPAPLRSALEAQAARASQAAGVKVPWKLIALQAIERAVGAKEGGGKPPLQAA